MNGWSTPLRCSCYHPYLPPGRRTHPTPGRPKLEGLHLAPEDGDGKAHKQDSGGSGKEDEDEDEETRVLPPPPPAQQPPHEWTYEEQFNQIGQHRSPKLPRSPHLPRLD